MTISSSTNWAVIVSDFDNQGLLNLVALIMDRNLQFKEDILVLNKLSSR